MNDKKWYEIGDYFEMLTEVARNVKERNNYWQSYKKNSNNNDGEKECTKQ